MQEHELTMRQMVEETHPGHLNIDPSAKFEVNRKTVKHWLSKVEPDPSGRTSRKNASSVKEKALTPSFSRTTMGPNRRAGS